MSQLMKQLAKWNSRKAVYGAAAILAVAETEADPTVKVAGIVAVAVALIFGQSYVDKAVQGTEAAKKALEETK